MNNTMMDNQTLIIKVVNGNPGALTFVIDAFRVDGELARRSCNIALIFNITGDKLYMLWNDCCNRDTLKAMFVLMHCKINDINSHINYKNGRGIPFTDEELAGMVRC